MKTLITVWGQESLPSMTESPGREIQAEQAFQVQQRGASAWRNSKIPGLVFRDLERKTARNCLLWPLPAGPEGQAGVPEHSAVPSVIWARGSCWHLWLHPSPVALGSGEQHLGWGSGHCQ